MPRLGTQPSPEYAPNPYYADVHLILSNGTDTGDDLAVIPPEYIQEFTYTIRMDNAANQVQIRLFDPEWDQVEQKLINSHDNAFFQFGYTNGSPPLRSGRYGVIMKSIGPSPRIDHVELLMEGVSAGLEAGRREAGSYEISFSWGEGTRCDWLRGSDNIYGTIEAPSGTPRIYDKGGMTVSQIAQEIAWKNKLIPAIDPTIPVLDYDSLESTTPANRTWTQNSITDMAFVKQFLLGGCRRASDEFAGYTFYVTDELAENVSIKEASDGSIEPGYELHLHPMRMDTGVEYEYIYQRDGQGSVISFDPEIDLAVFFAIGGGETSVPYSNHTTGSRGTQSSSLDSDQQKSVSDQFGVSFPAGSESKVGKSRLVTPRNQFEADVMAKQRFIEMFNQSVMADMVVQGDPRILPNKLARVLVLKPNLEPHPYMSGVYLIQEVVHTISGGNFHTSMKMIRNSLGDGPKSTDGHGVQTSTGSMI